MSATDLGYEIASRSLFSGVSFKVANGEHCALLGNNGIGKSTLLKILAGELTSFTGSVNVTRDLLYMPQDVGLERNQSLRALLLGYAAPALAKAGKAIGDSSRLLERGDAHAGYRLAEALEQWAALGGYELEGQWDRATRRIMDSPFADVADRDVGSLSGGEQKRLVLDVLLHSSAALLLLDEPDNFLDIPAKLDLEAAIASSPKTILLVSHDRELLRRSVTKIVTLEAEGAWVHGGSYEGYEKARSARQEALGNDLERWKLEERRLFHHYKLMKQRAAQNDKNAPKADAAESRWRRFVDVGPPPAPAVDQRIRVRLPGRDSARRVVRLTSVGFTGIVEPFSDEACFGERIGIVGPNGAGKSSVLRAIAGVIEPGRGSIELGPRVSPGLFTQHNRVTALIGRSPLAALEAVLGNREAAMRALARYGLHRTSSQPYETLSGGERARLEILLLELQAHNLLLLDEPTDNLDLDSAESLERALDGFDGTVLAVSHDRAFLKRLDRFIFISQDGIVLDVARFDTVIDLLRQNNLAGAGPLIRVLSDPPTGRPGMK